MEEAAEKALMNSALRALGRRAHSVQEMEEKLKKRPQYTPELAAKIIQKLKDKNFLNDEDLILRAIESAKERKFEGLQKLSQRLYRKGIAPTLVKSLWLKEVDDEKEVAKKALEKLEPKLRKLDQQKKIERRARHLFSRGFSPEICFQLARNHETL